MRHIFLINPRAGKRDRTDRLCALADRLSAAHGLDVACLVTDRPGGAESLARSLAETGGGRAALRLRRGRHRPRDGQRHCRVPQRRHDRDPRRHRQRLSQELRPGRRRIRRSGEPLGQPRLPPGPHRLQRPAVPDHRLLRHRRPGGGHRPPVRRLPPALRPGGAISCPWRPTSCSGPSAAGGPSTWTARRSRTTSPWCPCATAGTTAAGPCRCRKPGWTTAFSTPSWCGTCPRPPLPGCSPPTPPGEYQKFRDVARVVTAKEITIAARPGDEDIVTCLDGECRRSRQVRLRLSEKKVNFFGPAGCDPNATAKAPSASAAREAAPLS